MKGKWKQNGKKKKTNAVLQKHMLSVEDFVKSKRGQEEAESEHGLRFVKKKSRKELRKEKRKMKKAKMKSHYEGKKIDSVLPADVEKSKMQADTQPQVQKKKMNKTKKDSNTTGDASDSSKTPPSSKKRKKVNRLQESRKMALLEANEQEDREIKKLERCLGLNKRKNKKNLPQSFVADGLDYILGVLDSGSSAVGLYDDDDDMDMAKEKFEKLGENDSQLSDVYDEDEDEVASEGSDNDDDEIDDNEEEEMSDDDGEEDDDEMADEEEVEEEMDELNESDEADYNDENEQEIEEDAESPETKTLGSKSETVSSDSHV